jgi:FtsH-binding integral membrane protein
MDFTRSNQQTYSEAYSFDSGLRDYMVAVFRQMAIALVITGLVASFVSSSEAMMQMIFGTPLSWVVMLAPIAMAFFMSSMIMRLSLQAAQMTFYIFSALMGLSLSSIFMIYTGESIARVFFITASVFGAMSIYGYTTKRDLTSFGSFLIMGLIGIILASLVNIFLKSSMIHFITSILGLFIFIGLTAYDTQRIKEIYRYAAGSGDTLVRLSILGALSLYMDFINLFIHMLQFLGDRRN